MNNGSGGLFDGQQSQWFHIMMLQWTVQLDKPALANSQHDETFGRAGGDGVIGNPNPVVVNQRSLLHQIQPDADDEVLDSGVAWFIERGTTIHLSHHIQYTRTGSHRHSRVNDEANGKKNLVHSKMTAGHGGDVRNLIDKTQLTRRFGGGASY